MANVTHYLCQKYRYLLENQGLTKIRNLLHTIKMRQEKKVVINHYCYQNY